MLTGLQHSHSSFGYLIFLLLVVQFILAIAGGAKESGNKKAISIIQLIAVRIGGPLVIVFGIGMWHLLNYPITTWWIWVSWLLWGPMEVIAKRMIRPALAENTDGTSKSKLVLGAGLQVVILIAIIGLMSANAG